MKWFIFGKREGVIAFIVATVVIVTAIFAGHGVNAITASANERKLPIYCVQTADKKIALTFDAAWGNSDTDILLEILKKHNAKATFFFTGEWVSKYPDDVRKIFAAGHTVGNHSNSHSHIASMSAEQLRDDIIACNEKLKAVTGETPTLYRGPYGEYNNTLLTEVEKLKMYAIQWDIETLATKVIV